MPPECWYSMDGLLSTSSDGSVAVLFPLSMILVDCVVSRSLSTSDFEPFWVHGLVLHIIGGCSSCG